MKRRAFFARLTGAVAATAVAPSVLNAVESGISKPLAMTSASEPPPVLSYVASNGPDVWYGTFVPATTGTQTITGCPFSPSSIILYPSVEGDCALETIGANSFTVNWARNASRQ